MYSLLTFILQYCAVMRINVPWKRISRIVLNFSSKKSIVS